jgi:hypothetical protein
MWSNAPASLSAAAPVASPFGALRTTMPVRAHGGPAGSASHQLPSLAGGDPSDLTPLPWSTAFATKRDVLLPATSADASSSQAAATASSSSTDSFCVYSAGPAATAAVPQFVVLLLHGGGHSSLAWACVAVSLHCTMRCDVIWQAALSLVHLLCACRPT